MSPATSVSCYCTTHGFVWSIEGTWFTPISNDHEYNHKSNCSQIFCLFLKARIRNFDNLMYLNTQCHKRNIQIYTFSQTSRKNRKWLHFHFYRSEALIAVLNSNFYYLHLALHKFSAGHVNYSCTLSGGIGNNYVVLKILLKLTPINSLRKYL